MNPQVAGFVHQVFSLRETAVLGDLLSSCGFVDVRSRASDVKLRLPVPEEFLWQYVHSTPLAAAAAAGWRTPRSAGT